MGGHGSEEKEERKTAGLGATARRTLVLRNGQPAAESEEQGMKYFTPELIGRFQSPDDDLIEEIHEEWERAIVRSDRRWQKIRGAFPAAVHRFDDDHVCLHDAELLSIGQEGDRFVIVVQPEPPARTVVILTFTLDGEPTIDQTALPGREGRTHALWMYEEWDLDSQKRRLFEVLFTNGWSVKLRFRDFQYRIARRLFPVLTTAADPAFPPAQPAVSKPA
jgi:hypothetical protein